MSRSSSSSPSSVAVVVCGFILPGAGYWLLRRRGRALTIGITVLGLYLLGIFFAGIRVIDVPGFNNLGALTRVGADREETEDIGRRFDSPSADEGQSMLAAHPFGQLFAKPWYIGQFLVGPVNWIASALSIRAAQPAVDLDGRSGSVSRIPAVHSRIAEIGTLYTAVAGMLNLLAIIDSASLAGGIAAGAGVGGAEERKEQPA